MEHIEYIKRLESLKAEIRNLENRYIDELPFHTNDKIKIRGVFAGWLLSVKPCISGRVEIWFAPPKKNGEKSNSIRRLYLNINNIEVVND